MIQFSQAKGSFLMLGNYNTIECKKKHCGAFRFNEPSKLLLRSEPYELDDI